MNCPDARSWNLLSMNLLDESDAESLRQHSRECERCHAARQEAAQQHTELLAAFQAFDRNHDQQRDQLLAMLPHSAPGPETTSGAALWRRWPEEIAMIVRRHKVRWAAAALLPAACILLAVWLMAGERIAFAQVLEKVRQATTMVCDVVTTTTAVKGQLPDMLTKKPARGTIAISIDGDKRAELYEYEQFGQKYRMLFTGDKAYLWDGDKLHVIVTTDAVQRRPTENLLEQLLAVREAPDRNLGEQVINGRRAIGFEVAGWKLGLGTRPTKGNPTPVDSESRLRVWVDVKRDLPIRMEAIQQFVMPDATGEIHSQWDNIRWNVPLDAADFQPPSEEEIAKAETSQIPAIDGATVTIQTPALVEATFIDVMRAWVEFREQAKAGIDLMKRKAQEKGEPLPAEMTALFERAALGAGYPARLDMSWLTSAYAARSTLALLAETLAKQEPLPKGLGADERAKLIGERAKEAAMAGAQAASGAMLKATSAAVFYQRLANEQRNPEYFGSTVQPGDAKAILLRWKLDDGRYRVIYGDLRAATLDTAN